MMVSPKEEAVLYETDFEVPPWRKADITKMPPEGTKIAAFEVGHPETHLERIYIGTTIVSHDIDKKLLPTPWPRAVAIGERITVTLANHSNRPRRLSITLFTVKE